MNFVKLCTFYCVTVNNKYQLIIKRDNNNNKFHKIKKPLLEFLENREMSIY